MARPEETWITFEIDGREVRAPEGSMLVDAAKHGDVEIPYFCYEPKLGQPVGACRMCLVEIEGMPKLQTSCSTPVKDGMVVTTTSDQVKQAQNAIVEFLLINHPLDCPVCDKGGECPLQDISFGWGAGRSRYIEPKRHFKKPLELSPLVAIDRERCILCYRCVRFSQEVAEDHQLVFLERGDHTFVGTHDGRPYVAPFSGNIIELCPVGALTSTAYRFRARPWDVEEAGTICTLCPSQCNVKLTIRDDSRVVRVLARDNHDVDDGWLCDKGRFAYQSIGAKERITAPLMRDGGSLREVSWERALSEAAAALEKAGERSAAIAGGQATNEEGFLLQHLLRNGLGSPHVDSRSGGSLKPQHARVLARPELAAAVPDIEFADAIVVLGSELVDEAPILDLRVRKAVRRNGAQLVVATSRPSTLDASATASLRYAPGADEALLVALVAALGSPRGAGKDLAELARRAGASRGFRPGAPSQNGDAGQAVREAAELLRSAQQIVVLWGERLSQGARGGQAMEALLAMTSALGLGGREGAGLIEIPTACNGRGLREAGCVPNLGPGLSDAATAGLPAPEILAGLGEELRAVLLFQAEAPAEALERADAVIAFASFRDERLDHHADVVFPAESYAEKEGTLTHPDGRVQRVRQTTGHPGQVEPGWSVLAELCERLDAPLEAAGASAVTAAVAEAVPFYAGLTLDEIGGQGVRWQEREAASAAPDAEPDAGPLEDPPEPAEGLRVGAAPSLWGGPEVRHAPSLRFLSPGRRVELSVDDARTLGVDGGDEIVLSSNGTSLRATAAPRSAVPAGSVFLVGEEIAAGPVEVRKA
ncbi:MAG: NADH-quinone oxidoreductase subunit NuoG [Thermoleophilaceae bacterium]